MTTLFGCYGNLRDLPIPVEVTVIDDTLLERATHVPGLVRVASREGRVVERAAKLS